MAFFCSSSSFVSCFALTSVEIVRVYRLRERKMGGGPLTFSGHCSITLQFLGRVTYITAELTKLPSLLNLSIHGDRKKERDFRPN